MALKERKVVLVSKDAEGNTCMDMPLTTVDQVEGAVKTINGEKPDDAGNVKISTFSIDNVYPVGSIYMSVNSANPETLFGGTWEALDEGRVLIGAGSAYPAGSTGGEATHTLTTDEMPSHSHSGSAASAGSHRHPITASGEEFYSGYVTVGDYNLDTLYTGYAGSHSHSLSINNTGGGQAHNNMQPYLSVYMWKRTA